MPVEIHPDQLKRIAEDVQAVGEEKGWLSFLAGVNIAVLIIDLLLALAALIAFFSTVVDGPVGVGLAAILLALAVIVLILDLIAKWAHAHADAANDARLERLKGELLRKQESLTAEQKKLEPKPP